MEMPFLSAGFYPIPICRLNETVIHCSDTIHCSEYQYPISHPTRIPLLPKKCTNGLSVIHWCFAYLTKNQAAKDSLWHQLAYNSLVVGILSYWNMVYVFNQPMNNTWNSFNNTYQGCNICMARTTQQSLHPGWLGSCPTAEHPACPPRELSTQSHGTIIHTELATWCQADGS